MSKLASSILKAELSTFSTNFTENQEKEIAGILEKFEFLQTLNIPILKNPTLIKKKESIFFILSNGSVFISDVK